MAKKTTASTPREKVDFKGQLFLTLLMFLGIFGIAFILRSLLHMNDVYTGIFTAIILAIIVFYLFRKAQEDRWRRENNDAERTVNPIIERYTASHDARELVRSYTTWNRGAHDPDLRLQFSQLVVEALIRDGHTKDARTVLATMEEIATTTGNAKNFAGYKADVLSRIGA